MAGDETGYAHELNIALTDEAADSVGRVSLVGAGPGDPELLTLKAQRKLLEADVIVHDTNVGAGVLEMARRDALRIVVGKAQFETNSILVREARSGKHVVRLKLGNIGRDGGEQAMLKANGIAVDIVPGIAVAKAKTSADVVVFPTREDISTDILRAAS